MVSRNRHRRGEVFDYIRRPLGLSARSASPRARKQRPKTLVQEVASNTPGLRVFVVISKDCQAFERAQRSKAMNRVRIGLEKLQHHVREILRGAARALRPDRRDWSTATMVASQAHRRVSFWQKLTFRLTLDALR
jgi:hypothetical protein